MEQIVDFPGQTVEQIVDISPGDGLGLGSPHLLALQMRVLLGVFALFPMEKRCGCRAGGECAAGWARQLIHAERSSNASWRRARGLWRFRRVGQDA